MSLDDTSDDNPNIIKVHEGWEPSPDGLGWEIFRFMQKYKDNVAQYLPETDDSDTYQELLERSIRTSQKLKNDDEITRDDIIVLCSYNHKHSGIPFISALFLGVKIASIDTTVAEKDIIHLLSQVPPKVMFIVPEVVDKISNVVRELEMDVKLIVFGETEVYTSFDEYISEKYDVDDFEPTRIDSNMDTAVIFFSSGTTGLSKGILVSHYSLSFQSTNLILCGTFKHVSLIYTSLFWISSAFLLIAASFCGGARVLVSKFDGNDIWYIIDKYKVDFLFLAPHQCLQMYKNGRPKNVDTTNLRVLTTGGSIFNKSQMLALRDLLPGTHLFQSYGQTEVGGCLTVFNLHEPRDRILLYYKPDSCGRPLRGFWYKIVDVDSGEIMGPNQKGELHVKSKVVMNGYYNKDSSASFDNGWLKTGDICYYDEDQCFYVVDRIKELIKYQGWHIPPALLEEILVQHPAVQTAVVVGLPNEEDGEHPTGFVVLKDGFEDTLAENIQSFVEERVEERQRLRGGVHFVKSVPMTPSGKVQRNLLKQMIVNGEIIL